MTVLLKFNKIIMALKHSFFEIWRVVQSNLYISLLNLANKNT